VVGIVVVSHSEALAEGVVALAREMGGDQLALEAAGGIAEPGVLGTDAERVRAAIERAMSTDGVLVLMDLGSALMSAEFALEMVTDRAGPVCLSAAPLVEGAVAAAVAARGGATLDEVAAEARGALAMKASQLGAGEPAPGSPVPDGSGPAAGDPSPAGAQSAVAPAPDAHAELPVRNEIGLHARPAARFIELARSFEADVCVAKAGGGEPVRATSLTNVVALGARRGDTLLVSATGPQARQALDALRELADDGFGDGLAPGGAQSGAGRPAGEAPPTARDGSANAHDASAAGEAARGRSASETPAQTTPPQPGDVLTGVAASAGIALAPARHLHGSRAAAPPPERDAELPARERARLKEAIEVASVAIRHDRDAIAKRAGRAEAEIFDAHVALLDDDALLDPAYQAIDDGGTAEAAWHEAAEQVAERYRALSEPLLRERATDVLDVGRRVVDAIIGEESTSANHRGIVIVGELTPADAAKLDPALVEGIATAHGAATAHAAILARALSLPAVVGLGDAVLAIAEDTPLLLDGDAGTLLIDPPAEVARDAEARRERAQQRRAAARERTREPGVTRDGARVEVFANLGKAGEAAGAVELGAEGVGLLRTEFLFLGRAELPDEEEQIETLREIAGALDGRPLVVRTLDAGADKPLAALPMPAEANPFLGVRGIRIGLERPELLETQFRAILRVAAQYPVKAMLPMVATAGEVLRAREILERARAATRVRAALELGIMVEVPAAALTASHLARHVDFFSLGTNDLTQYTMAAERGNERLSSLLSGPQPAVLALVRATVQAASQRGRWVGVCGELAGDPAAAVLLVGLGITELSMAPALIPEVKAALRSVDLSEARSSAAAALEAEDADAARALAARLL
jgi:phosphoenolpyruvate-protein phosphotransferase/dihydroxyacetone kinase phosphotransfer subunit